MYYTDDSILPEYMAPLIITSAPFGPQWLPGDADIPVSWDEQVQTAVDSYNAGATVLHVHVRNPATGKGSTDFDQYNHFIGLLKNAVPKMILQVGGSISFSPKTDDAKAKWLNYDTRHMLTELDPKPEFVTVAVGTGQWDIISMMHKEDVEGTHLADPKVQAAWAGMVVDAVSRLLPGALEAAQSARDSAVLCARSHPPTGAHRASDSRRRLYGPAESRSRRLRWWHTRPQSVPLDGVSPSSSARRGGDILVQHARIDLYLWDGARPGPAHSCRQ